jgi:hypothetical protein
MSENLPVTVQPKPKSTSKTIWWNVAATVAALLAAPEIIELLGPVLGVKATAALVAGVNIALRLWTSVPLVGTPGQTKAEWGE